jgi:hypothetical protein
LKKTDFKFWFKIKIDLLLNSCQIERISEMFQGWSKYLHFYIDFHTTQNEILEAQKCPKLSDLFASTLYTTGWFVYGEFFLT